MSLSLYRKYRPQTFSDVSGQKTAVEVITKSIAKSRVGHAYLFSGSRGCGKTSIARIFAKALNCLNRNGFEPCGTCSNCTAITAGESLDVIEIDGASNNGVDEVRELKANVNLAPFSSRYKIYIIDEVHMLSQGAFNALLKTLEEPPEHVIFILATTEPHKVPVTIRSRCQHIPFHSITPEDIFARLNYVCEHENINTESEALWEISRQADGALRDALSLLEQVSAAGEVTLQNVESVFGAGSRSSFERWVKTLRENPGEAYVNLKSMFDSGALGVRVFEEIFSLVRNLWLVSKWQNIADNLGASELEKNFLRDESQNWKPEKLHTLLNAVNKALVQARMGVKNDILLGMFALFVDPAPVEIPDSGMFHEQITVMQTTQPASGRQVNIADKYDADLHEELIQVAREKNFVLTCGLYHVKPYAQDGTLILVIEDAYIYETLRRARTAAAIDEIFDSYEHIILRFGTNETICPKFSSRTETREKTPGENESQDTNENNNNTIVNEQSSFSKIRTMLARIGAHPEILILKRKELSESESESEPEESEIESESESEGDDE